MKKSLKITLNIAIFLVIVGFVWYIAQTNNRRERIYVEIGCQEPFESRYKEVLSFQLPGEINSFELYGDKLFVSVGRTVHIHNLEGERLISFDVNSDDLVRDITVNRSEIYVLYSLRIEVYNKMGELLRAWQAESEESDFCAIAVAGDYVFATDITHLNIAQFTREGDFVRTISSPSPPRGFIIPNNYAFDIAVWNNRIYVTNSGRHLIESYTLDGEFVASFGNRGGGAGSFAGCCNPIFITFTPNGDLLTSEKGNPRVSLFDRRGLFEEILLNSHILGGGTRAYRIRATENKLFVGGRNRITVFEEKE